MCLFITSYYPKLPMVNEIIAFTGGNIFTVNIYSITGSLMT